MIKNTLDKLKWIYDWYYLPYIKYSQLTKLISSNIEALIYILQLNSKILLFGRDLLNDISSWWELDKWTKVGWHLKSHVSVQNRNIYYFTLEKNLLLKVDVEYNRWEWPFCSEEVKCRHSMDKGTPARRILKERYPQVKEL